MAATLRALVVDDDEACVEHVSAILRKFEWNVEQSHDGLDALRRCQSARYDLVICDIRMPRLSGLSFLSNLSQTRNAMTRVVMVSALDDRAIRRQALASGASAYLVKPLDTRALIDALALPSIRPVDESP
ncbi:MAG: response regulator [Betaproteobacteria bacterium]|nr:response regulator [Betaproteobacteria bacterium]